MITCDYDRVGKGMWRTLAKDPSFKSPAEAVYIFVHFVFTPCHKRAHSLRLVCSPPFVHTIIVMLCPLGRIIVCINEA